MRRRDVNWLIVRAAGICGGAQFFESWMRAAQEHQHGSNAPPEPDRWTGYQPKFFAADEFQVLDTFTAILIPSDGTPGAHEAHVAAFVDFVVNAAAEYARQTQEQWRAAMDYLQGEKFGELTPAEQVAFIEQMSEPERDRAKRHPGFETYRLIKEMTVHAFYTSRVGLIDVLEYKGMAYLTEFPACTHPEHHKV